MLQFSIGYIDSVIIIRNLLLPTKRDKYIPVLYLPDQFGPPLFMPILESSVELNLDKRGAPSHPCAPWETCACASQRCHHQSQGRRSTDPHSNTDPTISKALNILCFLYIYDPAVHVSSPE